MADKEVAMLIRHSPLNTYKGSEALRQSVGLTLAENAVKVLLVDAAAWLATPLSPEAIGGKEIGKHIEMLLSLKVTVKVEEESLRKCGINTNRLIEGILQVKRSEIIDDLTSSDAVICF